MTLGDLFEVVVAFAVATGVLGGMKKKKPPARRPLPPRRPPGRPRVEPARGSPGDRLLADLVRQLEAARAPARVPDPPDASSLERIPVEAESLETLEAAGEASHARFHQRYIKPLAEVRSVRHPAAAPPGGMPAAVVWAEILGPPKGLQ